MRIGELSLHMIVKNEAEFLPGLLSLVAPYIGEMIIVDTGSSDDTVAIATRFTKHVYAYDMKKDFSAARNFALGKATKSWILQLDADELPTEPLLEWLSSFVPEPWVSGVRILRHNLVDNKPIGFYTYEWHTRLFQRHIRFVGVIHEKLPILDAKVMKAPSDCFIQHYKTQARQEEQNARYATWVE